MLRAAALLLALPTVLSLATDLPAPPHPAGVSQENSHRSASPPREGVVLLHGLARTAKSMAPMEAFLKRQGYAVFNSNYPSRTDTITALADSAIAEALRSPKLLGCKRIHFVTHSLGGILVRSWAARHTDARFGRVVMLGPPNGGSEVVDRMADWKTFQTIGGPAGGELGTGSGSTPNRLGPIDFECGVIAGDRSINWINSWTIPGPDDGKVSVARTMVPGMKEHLVVHTTHVFMMKNERVLRYTLNFLRTGSFQMAPRGAPGRSSQPPDGN